MKCSNCKKELSDDNFYFRKDLNKYRPNCKICQNKIQLQRKKNGLVKNRIIFDFVCLFCNKKKAKDCFYFKDKNTGRYDTTCKECRKNEAKKWHFDNHLKSLNNKKKWYENNREYNISKFKENYKLRMMINPEKEYENRKNWRLSNSDKINYERKIRYATDPNFKLGNRLRSNCYRIIKEGCKKNSKTMKMLGCDIDFIKEWLEGQFQEGMNWKNQGSYWHLDHFFPVASFDLSKDEEQNKCFHWSNLQPLTKKQNLSKNKKMPLNIEIELHLDKILKFCELKDKEVKSIIPEIKGSISG
jgi:hypothetical protein